MIETWFNHQSSIQEAKEIYFKVIDGDDGLFVKNLKKFLNNLETIDAEMIIFDFTDNMYNSARYPKK